MTETKEAETAQIETAIQDANFEKAVEEERTKKCRMFCDSEINVLPICENCLMNESVDLKKRCAWLKEYEKKKTIEIYP